MTLEKLAEDVAVVVQRLGTLADVGEKYASDSVGSDSQLSVAAISSGLYEVLEKEASAQEVCLPELIEKLANVRGKEVSNEMRIKLAAAVVTDKFLETKIAEGGDTASHFEQVQFYGREFCAELLKEVL